MATFSVDAHNNYFDWSCSGLQPINEITSVVLTLTNYGASTTQSIVSFNGAFVFNNQTSCTNRYNSGDSTLLSFSAGDIFTLYCYRWIGDEYRYLVGSKLVIIPAIQLSPPAYDSTNNITHDSITVYYKQVTGGDYYYIRAYKKDGTFVAETSNVNFVSGARVSATFNNLIPDTEYKFRCRCSSDYGYYGDSDWSNYSVTTKTKKLTQLATPSVSSYTEGPTSISIKLNTTPNAFMYSIDCYQYISGSYEHIRYKSQSNTSFVFDNLTPDTSYMFVIVAIGSGGYLNSDSLVVVYDTEKLLNPDRPSYFSWTIPKVSGKSFSVLASEWNRLVQNVKDVHEYKEGVYSFFLYPMHTVQQGDIFYADRFNEVRLAIGSLNPTNLQDKISGDPIKADDLNLIVQKLNEIS